MFQPPEQLLLLICNGDTVAFRQLYDLFKDRVYNTCLGYLQNEQEAEEVTQDVFVEIHHSAAKYKGQATVSTWVYRITINKCLDLLRYKNRKKRFSIVTNIFSNRTGELIHDPPDFEHPGVKAENKERARILFAVIKKLPENQQTAFILKQVEGLKQREIAAIMNLNEKAVESLLQRAKNNLTKLLENYKPKDFN